jgi:hypothetical protein
MHRILTSARRRARPTPLHERPCLPFGGALPSSRVLPIDDGQTRHLTAAVPVLATGNNTVPQSLATLNPKP